MGIREIGAAVALMAIAAGAANGQTTSTAAAPAAPTPLTITVQPGPRQTFSGLGVSQNNFMNPYDRLSPARRALLARLLYKDLNLRILRLWFDGAGYSKSRGQTNPGSFVSAYITSHVIADARANGIKTLLLAPGSIPSYMLEDPANHSSHLKASELGNYAAMLAGFILNLRNQYRVTIDATGVANEPPWFTPATMAAEVKALRAALDERGLRRVQIVAPENANNDDSTDSFLSALKTDPAAWRAITAIATHSYNMAPRPQEAAFVAGTEKQFWITEAGGGAALPTSEGPDDGSQAASMSSRFLNDMNHRVTDWIWFLGAEEVTHWPVDFDNVQRLIEYRWERPIDWYLPLLKYYYLRQISRTFAVGAVFRKSFSSLEGDMTWTYGRKPRLTAAAARNPDGSWAMALVDYTSDEFLKDNAFDRDNSGFPPQSFTVTIDVPELAHAGDIPFRVHRNSEILRDVDEGVIIMRSGRLTLGVTPLELLTLRSAPVPHLPLHR